MRRPMRTRGVATTLMWFLFYLTVVGGGSTLVVLRAWAETQSHTQTLLAGVLYAAVLKVLGTRHRLAHQRRLRDSLPRYYDVKGTTAL